LLSLLLVLSPRPGWATAAPARGARRVLLVIDQPDDPFAERIRAELKALGLEVLAVEPWRTGEAIDSLEAAARREQADAAIRMVASRKGVEVWMTAQTLGRPLLRQLVIDESPDGPNQGLVALQTVELLRTGLLSVHGAAPPDEPSGRPMAGEDAAAPAATLPAPSPPSLTQAGAQAAVGALFSPGGTGASLQLWLSIHRTLTGRIGLALDLSLPLSAATASGPEGSARVGSWLVGAALFARFQAPEVGLRAALGGGAGLVRIAADGRANPPLVSRSEDVVSAAGYLRADGGFEATRWLSLGLRGVAGLSIDQVALRFGGNQAATWGRPFLAALVLADLCWR
jgi:hypothetical protein